MDDPASRISQQLLPHMHLVSLNRYPNMHMMPTETAVEYLASAPRICQSQPMSWTFLDGPADGTVMLTWQPHGHMGANFASDGHVWADVEQAVPFEVRGYTVEMYTHRSGYHPPNETVATHCRKRYRIVACNIPNAPQPDPSLWIVHYSRAPQQDHVPANRIPVPPPVQNMMAQRRFLQSQGQLLRKEFLLHDRNNWPTINFPPQAVPQQFAPPQQPYQAAQGQVPRPGFYPPQGHQVPAPAQPKPARAHRASSAAVAAASADFALEDEDVSSGDVLDLVTPREVSKMRYVQHHEWMEEIFASPYAISQIAPVSLGLGRKGELESLTAGFFDAPGPSGEGQGAGDAPDATKMEPAKAEEFADRVAKKVADMTAEIEKLKKQHARRMERFNRSSLFKDAELRLREAATDPTQTGPEVWRLEGRIDIPNEDDETPQLEYVEDKAKYRVDDVVRDVESSWKKQIVPEPKVSCVEKGGLLEKIEPEHKEEPESFTNDMMLDQGESHLLNQFGSPAADNNGSAPAQPMPSAEISADVEMDLGDQLTAGRATGETGDWVMVNDESKEGAPAPEAGDASLETTNFDDFTNIDSAGDALAAYTEQNDELDLPDLENSAFGDAFHASDNEHSHNPDADEIS
ncbi:hypothetical protein N7462_011654 [Penicillium macrosclerotiorum]|uniref:uncharacterized protein n=1 Tax=Penicillium macrosclerotiorum TaxID=303699 RepID=UPI0025487757|nr:uncharacterized protein N7462_011654 [Penicillium macrosclerotiorum]KAJ5662728.1 hypothetical protein N7462_011654 [Penicillium macrosclerotiorum]